MKVINFLIAVGLRLCPIPV